MALNNLSIDEKRRLSNERQNAVRNAWKEEKARVENGQGTRNWNISEQKELLTRGSVSGYEGHHMKSVSDYLNEAGNPKNIQFLSEEEHLMGAHQGSFHNTTNGYYNTENQKMYEFKSDELIYVPVVDLTEKQSESDTAALENARNNYTKANESNENSYPESPDFSQARRDYESEVNYITYRTKCEENSESKSNGMGR